MGYDIIGDIHGEYGKLLALLSAMGYQKKNGAWRHPERTAIFVGDFIDRGPKQRDTVNLVRAAVKEGAARAVMGNHEFNAIAWYLPDPAKPGEFLRPHSPKNRLQHRAFLAEVEHNLPLHRDLIDWFLTLPLWLDLDGVRVAHSCWHGRFMDYLAPMLAAENLLTAELMVEASEEPLDTEKDSPEPSVFKAVEAVLKGIEIPLPLGHDFMDKDGITRDRVRVRWWDQDARTYRAAALLSDRRRAQLPDEPVPDHVILGYDSPKPVFVGHYWWPPNEAPRPLSSRVACVDYSAAKNGPLVAYRWDGEDVLDATKFVLSGR
jgi:hypothetical protein